jgi:HKD family nuclease
MKDRQLILKERLIQKINGRKVIAALFYTFNFDPKFFENYVMPVLVPAQTFTNNNITNNILWRRLYKDQQVPAVTVYFDQNAKSTEWGPYLDYQIVPVNIPSVGKNKGNFHPKLSFILIENDDHTRELLFLSGSNNLTQSGWCENLECVSDYTFVNGKDFPTVFKKALRDLINMVCADFRKKFTEAEEQILSYLNKLGTTQDRGIIFYDSFQMSFSDFLAINILSDESVKMVEILSPYFKSTPEMLNLFFDRKIQVRIQTPIKNGYCLADPTVIHSYAEAGVRWYQPFDETRSNHSKVYRFYGDKYTYTIIGSVNFTGPAWEGYLPKTKKISNIECAILFIEKEEDPVRLLKREIQPQNISFLEVVDSEENRFERIDTPDIIFSIDWVHQKLSWVSKSVNHCVLELSYGLSIPVSGKDDFDFSSYKNGASIMEALARKPLLKVIEDLPGEKREHYYYMEQSGFENRPLEFRISTADIIDSWEMLANNDPNLQEWLLTRLESVTDLIQDESGKMIEEYAREKSVLNEIARHFYGLLKLESYLFNPSILKKSKADQLHHFNNLRYYLTCDNVDTLYSYWKYLKKQYQQKEIMGVVYWLLLSVLINRFYTGRELKYMLKSISAVSDTRAVKTTITALTDTLHKELQLLEKQLPVDRNMLQWTAHILANEYEDVA